LKVLLVSALARLVGLLPARAAATLARPLGWLAWQVSPRLRTVSLKNLELCYPDMPAGERVRLARAAMRHYARNGIELGILWYWSRRRFDRLFLPAAGERHYREARAAGRGVLVLAPHYGAWELLGLRITPELDGATLYKPGDSGAIEAKLIRKRGRFGARLTPATRRGLKALVESLRDGKGSAVLPDQEPTAGTGRFAPFFGVPALTGVLVPRLLEATGARAVYAVCRRCPGGRYQVHWLPAEPELYSADPDESLAALNRGVERCIAVDPAQYLWGYKRFRAGPDGQRRFY